MVWKREQAYFSETGGRVVRRGVGDFAGYWLLFSPRNPGPSSVRRTPYGWLPPNMVVTFHRSLADAKSGVRQCHPWKKRGETRHSLRSGDGKQLIVRVPFSRTKWDVPTKSRRRYAFRMFRNGSYVGTAMSLDSAKARLQRSGPVSALVQESPAPKMPRTTRGRKKAA